MHTRIAFFLAILLVSSSLSFAQANIAESDGTHSIQSNDATIEELIGERIQDEWRSVPDFKPEILRTEADYARLSATSHDVLYASSFHLQPRYYSRSSTGPDTTRHGGIDQPVMYYVGTARTPLALPIVSNLSKALSGNEASYTINIGILPLPVPKSPDSIHYVVIIEREIESNHTDASVRLERFHKEFTQKAGEPVYLRLADEPLAKGEYILQLESGTVLDFYDDFSRFIEEHIILKSDPLSFQLGHETVSDVSDRLSIPYSIARTCMARVELLSVVDTAHPLTIVDTLREPADYLAELDMSKYADGPYQYRFTARELETGKILYSETHLFQKTEPVTVSESSRIEGSDTLRVGGNKVDWEALADTLHNELQSEEVLNEQVKSTLDMTQNDKHKLELIVDASQESTIADVHGRVGVGTGTGAGDNLFIGIESNRPSLSFDISFGFLYGSAPYLNWTPSLIQNIFSSSKSIGFNLQWIPVKLFQGWLEPLIGLSYYGLWSSSNQSSLTSAALIEGMIGIACEPLGEMHGLGFSLSYGPAYGLGLTPSSVGDLNFKAYIRF